MSDWGTHPLGDLCDVLDSKRKPITQRDREPGPFPYYGATGILDYVKDYIFDEKLVLIGEDGAKWGANERSAFIAEGQYWVNNHAHVIRPHRDEVLDEWLVYYLNYADLSPFISGLTVPKLNQGQMREIPIPVAPLPEQQRIVTKLDAAFGALREAEGHVERNRANARELFESYLNGVFEGRGNEWVRLDEVCEITSMLVDPRLPEHLDLVHVGGGNIESKTGRLLDLKTARQEELRSGKFLFDKSMVLYNKIRPYLVKVARPSFSGLCSADMYPLSPKAGLLDRDYLYYALISIHFTEYAISGSDRAGMPKVNREHLFAYEFPLPSMKEQHRIAKALDALLPQTQALEATYQQKLRELEGLKKGLLGAAFRGNL